MLRSKNITYNGYDFLALEVRVPTDGRSASSNWCYDYQYMCNEFHRKPTGCGVTYINTSPYSECRIKYNSDMNIGDVLNCNPSDHIAAVANIAFPNSSPKAEASKSFGFHTCNSCSKTLGQDNSLLFIQGWQSSTNTYYTLCR